MAVPLVLHIVEIGVIPALLLTVPPLAFLMRSLKVASALATKAVNRTPTATALIVEALSIPEGVSSILKSSTSFKTASALYVVASSGLISLTLVKLLADPSVPPTWTVKVLLSPAALGLK